MFKKKKTSWQTLNRKIHYWGSIIIALPILIIIITGILLILRKEIAWVQPPTQKGEFKTPTIKFEQILSSAKSFPQANIKNWDDISRLDVRPSKGVIKIRAKNNWEVQIDHNSGKILQTAFRRSSIIESIHEGQFFHQYISLGVFFPSAVILLILWITGLYLFIIRFTRKKQNKKNKKKFLN